MSHLPTLLRRLTRVVAFALGTLALDASAQPSDPATAPQAPAETEAADAPAPRLPPTEAELARGARILEIEVVGNRRVSRQDILTFIDSKIGGDFTPEGVTRDVRQLWKVGFFEDVEVDMRRVDSNVVLRFTVRERPSVGELLFNGNNEMSTEDLTEAVELKVDTVLSRPAIERAVQHIRDKYAEKGYFLAEVTSEILPRKNNQVAVEFRIKENTEVTVKRVTFIGNENISEEELRATMYTGQSSILALGSGGPFRQDAFERDVSVISALYYDRGYLTVQISTPRIMLTPDRSGIELSITIDEGPRFKIRKLRVYERSPDGGEVEPIGGRRNLRMMVRAKSGDYFNRSGLIEDLGAVRTLYRDHGFANVDANPETRLDPENAEVDVSVPVVRGPLVHFERIEFRGNSKTRDKVLRREMEVLEGESFHETRLEKSRQRITALGYFERVDISTEQGSTADSVNVYVEVTERPTGTFQVGAGFSSIESFIATAQVQQANLFGNGQSLSLQAQVSGLRQMVNLRLFEPYFLDSKFNASIDLYDQLRVYSDFSQSSRGGALTFGYPIIDPEVTASLTYTAEYNKVSTDSTTTFFGTTSSAVSVFRTLPLYGLFNDGLTSSIRPALTYDARDNRLFPTKGVYLYGSTELAASQLGSDTEFLRNRLIGRFYYPVASGLVLKLNSQSEMVTSPGSDGVPIFARSFLGGILDLRGFRFRSVGPRIAIADSLDPNSRALNNGANIGGNLSYYQNLELEWSVVESAGIKAVLFTDAGNAWNLEQKYCDATSSRYSQTSPCFDGLNSLSNLRTSWGFGLRWFSPMGPLRFEWGFPFRPLPYEEPMVFEFTIGNFF
jgi:outer membrane protein insertion porin family